MSDAKQIDQLAEELAHLCKSKQLSLCTAESCTGGWASQAITSMPGSSHWFERGFVVYNNLAKQEMLGVDGKTLQEYGAVSEQTALEMAVGALNHSPADVSLAITGVAGPGGGSEEKPVGTVCFAWAGLGKTASETQCFEGDRQEVRLQAVAYSLSKLIEKLSKLK